jgi:CheY-like chemotaxis protein
MQEGKNFNSSEFAAKKDLTEESENRFRVLLVDDDPRLRNLLSAVLTGAGYEVLTAGDGQEAWTQFRQSLHRIAALVSDVEMPKMSGVELAKLAGSACPALPILLMSGSPFPSAARPLSCGFLQKPFRPAAFLHSVQGIVNQPKRPVASAQTV